MFSDSVINVIRIIHVFMPCALVACFSQSFFGRTYNNVSGVSECKNGGRCEITKKNRTSCKSCRLRKCLSVGMSKSGSRYGRRSNWFKIHCLLSAQSQSQSNGGGGGGGGSGGMNSSSSTASSASSPPETNNNNASLLNNNNGSGPRNCNSGGGGAGMKASSSPSAGGHTDVDGFRERNHHRHGHHPHRHSSRERERDRERDRDRERTSSASSTNNVHGLGNPLLTSGAHRIPPPPFPGANHLASLSPNSRDMFLASFASAGLGGRSSSSSWPWR